MGGLVDDSVIVFGVDYVAGVDIVPGVDNLPGADSVPGVDDLPGAGDLRCWRPTPSSVMQEEPVNDTANKRGQRRGAQVLVGTGSPIMATGMHKVMESQCRAGSAGF